MEILYIGDLTPGGTCLMRLRALEDLGHRVCGLTTVPDKILRWQRSLLFRLVRRITGPIDWAGVNREILRAASVKSWEILWLDKALTVKASTLASFRELQPECKIVGYSPDDMYAPHNHSRQFLEHLPLYDAFFTTKSYGVAELKSLGCPRVEFTENAFDPHTHRPMQLTPGDYANYGADVGFIGTFEADRAAQMTFLAKSGIPVKIIGNYWERWTDRPPAFTIRNGEVHGDEYAKAICATKINLCFLRKINRDLQTQRSIEIPACGGFMLAERTDEHCALFEEGKEAEFFSSQEELLSKVRYYLKHPIDRERIAAAGRKRCLDGGYSYQDRLRQIINAVIAPQTSGS